MNESLLVQKKILFFDTETEGLFGANRLVQLKWPGEDKVFIFDRDVNSAKKIISEADILVVHNAFYEFNCDEFINFEFKAKIFDTLLACKYDKPCEKKFDLKSCLERYNIGTKGGEGKSNWSGELTEEQVEYAKNDVILLEKLYDKVSYVNKNKSFALDMYNYKYAVKYSHNGFPVLHSARLKFIQRYKEEEAKLLKTVPDSLNINSPKQVKRFLGTDKSDKETLTELNSEGARNILKLRELSKKISTLEKKFNYDRVKSIFKPAQAKSGRWTASKRGGKTGQYQNLQQIDRDLKNVFGFNDDNNLFIVDADYSSLEMFTASSVFNSSTMMKLLIEGKDLHTYTASQTLNKPESEVTKFERQMAKGLNFGTIYGAGVEVVSIFIQTYTGTKMPINKVRQARTKWLETYHDIKKYHARVGAKFKGKRKMLVRTPMGRPICAESYTEAINTPAQGFGSEVTKMAHHLLHSRLPNVKVINTVHDSITLEVEGFDSAKKVAIILKECLDESWIRCKKYINNGNPLFGKLFMDNIATVHKVYEGEELWSTEL